MEMLKYPGTIGRYMSGPGKHAEMIENEYETLYSVKELLKSRRDSELHLYGEEAGYIGELLERTEKLLLKLIREQRNH